LGRGKNLSKSEEDWVVKRKLKKLWTYHRANRQEFKKAHSSMSRKEGGGADLRSLIFVGRGKERYARGPEERK